MILPVEAVLVSHDVLSNLSVFIVLLVSVYEHIDHYCQPYYHCKSEDYKFWLIFEMFRLVLLLFLFLFLLKLLFKLANLSCFQPILFESLKLIPHKN